MDGLIEALLNVPPAKDGMDSYLASIRSKSDVIMTAATNVQGSSSTLLSTLNELAVEHCTAGYALLLSLHSDALSEPVYGSFLQTCIRFFERANVASASFVGFEGDWKQPKRDARSITSELFSMLCSVTRVARAMVHAAFQLNRPRAVVKALHTAVRVMSPSPSCLTCAHALLLQVMNIILRLICVSNSIFLCHTRRALRDNVTMSQSTSCAQCQCSRSTLRTRPSREPTS